MFSKDLIDDASSFKYDVGDKFKLFGIKVKIINIIWATKRLPKNNNEKLYKVYIENIDRYSMVSERMLNKNGEMI